MMDGLERMGDTELSISFKSAKDPEAQVSVLADLNCCSPFKIAERLEKLGCFEGTKLHATQFSDAYTPTPPASRMRHHNYPKTRRSPSTEPFDELRAMELFRDGLDDVGIAEILDVSVSRVRQWRRRMHLTRPRGGSHVKNDATPPAPEPALNPSRLLTVAEFLSALSELLTPASRSAALILNGTPVVEIASVCVRNVKGSLSVDIVTEAPD